WCPRDPRPEARAVEAEEDRDRSRRVARDRRADPGVGIGEAPFFALQDGAAPAAPSLTCSRRRSEGEALADAIGDGAHLQSHAAGVGEELLGGRSLAERPQLPEHVPPVAAAAP